MKYILALFLISCHPCTETITYKNKYIDKDPVIIIISDDKYLLALYNVAKEGITVCLNTGNSYGYTSSREYEDCLNEYQKRINFIVKNGLN